MISKYHTKTIKVIILLTAIVVTSCKKLVTVDPPITSTNTSLVFQNDASATAALTGIYTRMSSDGIKAGITSLSLFGSLSADDLSVMTGFSDIDWLAYHKNALTSNTGKNFWKDFYQFIFFANSALEGLNENENLTPKVRQQLIGEAKFIRSFCYFYLVNLYGEVPLILTTDYKKNSIAPRVPVDQVYGQIIVDLKEAKNDLSPNYLDASLNSTVERVSPTKWAAGALLARVYLYQGKFHEAIGESTTVISNTTLYDTIPVNTVYLKNSKEAIWQIQSVSNVFTNTTDARLFLLPASGPNSSVSGFPVYLNSNLINSFEQGDERKVKWTQSVTVGGKTFFYASKYRSKATFAPVTEHVMVLRLAEQFLIRAEAKIKLNDVAAGVADLNILRKRARSTATSAMPDPLPPLPSNLSQEQALDAVMRERRFEFFTEWGHRWLDLKRLGKIDEVMSVAASFKGSNWEPFKQFYPIPQNDIQLNSSLTGHQNAGY